MAEGPGFAFVLVRPRAAGNIGAAARALKNMGFSDLRLVAPARFDAGRAAAMAVHARDVVGSARVYEELGAALADRTLSVGTTCRPGLYRSGTRPLREVADELVSRAAVNRVAIIFGCEEHGLTNRELALCQRLVTIPSAAPYPSLNLAQAVMLFAYELRMAADGGAPAPASSEPFVAAGAAEAMLKRLERALVGIGFLPEDNPGHIMFALRALFGRSGLTARELDILNGVASQIRWIAGGGRETLLAKRRAGRKLR